MHTKKTKKNGVVESPPSEEATLKGHIFQSTWPIFPSFCRDIVQTSMQKYQPCKLNGCIKKKLFWLKKRNFFFWPIFSQKSGPPLTSTILCQGSQIFGEVGPDYEVNACQFWCQSNKQFLRNSDPNPEIAKFQAIFDRFSGI